MEAVTTIELDRNSNGFDDLHNQLLNNKGQKANEHDIRDKEEVREERKEQPASKKYVFRKGEETFEVDDDYEMEFVADKKPTRLTLRELKDRAAGDIAVKNRMHALAEEKKKVQSTLKEFAKIAKSDPLGALEYISTKAKESDSEFEYSQYLEKLAEQAEKLGQMDESEREAWELKKKLSKAEQDLSQKERQQAVVLRKQEMLSEYPEIGDQQFGQMVDAVLSNEELLEGLQDENDVMDRVEDLIQETLLQKDIIGVIQEINPQYAKDNGLIFALSDQLRRNPDLDEEDVRDIVQEIIGKKSTHVSQKERDFMTLSNKAREAAPMRSLRTQNADPFDLLKEQLLQRKAEFSKTPIYKR